MELTFQSLRDDKLSCRTCRHCHGYFSFDVSSEGLATILCGIPDDKISYKAISFVWGETQQIELSCDTCSRTTTFPMSSIAKFRQILQLIDNEKALLDVLSIDQANHEDVAAQVAALGRIYGQTTCVLVLLPAADAKALDLLAALSSMAKDLLRQRKMFYTDYKSNLDDETSLDLLSKAFFNVLLEFEKELPSFSYWKRAWTFQEWSLARDLNVIVERHDQSDKKSMNVISELKSSVFAAATLLASYKLHHGQYAEVRMGFARGEVQQRFDILKRIFPYEDYLLSVDEVDGVLDAYQTVYPSSRADMLLGLRVEPHSTCRPLTIDLKELMSIPRNVNSVKTDLVRYRIMNLPEQGFPKPPSLNAGSAIRTHQRGRREISAKILDANELFNPPRKIDVDLLQLPAIKAKYIGMMNPKTLKSKTHRDLLARLNIMLNGF